MWAWWLYEIGSQNLTWWVGYGVDMKYGGINGKMMFLGMVLHMMYDSIFMALGRMSCGWLNMRYEWGMITKIDMILTCVVNISW